MLVVDGLAPEETGRDPAVLPAYRDAMETTAERWATAHGFTVWRVMWASLPPIAATIQAQLRLEAYLIPVTDGVWGEIRAARAEDEADLRAEQGTVGPGPDGELRVVHVDAEPR